MKEKPEFIWLEEFEQMIEVVAMNTHDVWWRTESVFGRYTFRLPIRELETIVVLD